jgi:hypothetical protein
MKVLMLASGLSAKQVHDYDYKANGWTIVAINNGWQATDDWSWWVRASDFKGKRPTEYLPFQREVRRYGGQLGKFGGQKACGYSITLNAGYWALDSLKPTVMGFLGADMNYTPDAEGNTHLYGVGWDIQNNDGGVPDPDRMVNMYANGNENYLHDIYMRLAIEAEKFNGCKVYNLSTDADTRLPYEKARPEDFENESD